ncbi:MAG: spore germination protein, partial [Clostridia bacterium]|nr:spore germination protein [Clostridia bacterium]
KKNDLIRQSGFEFPDFTVDSKGELAENSSFSSVLQENQTMLQSVFSGGGTFICRDFSSEKPGYAKCFAVYFDGLVKNESVYDSVIRPVVETDIPVIDAKTLSDRVICNVDTQIISTAKECFDAMFMGDCVIFLEGCTSAVVASTKGFPVRTPQEPSSEKVLLGPREGFTESVMMNVSMIHRKLKTVDFRAEPMTFGSRTQSKAFLCYLDSIVHPELLKEVKRRLQSIEIDGVLDANYIIEQISDHPMSLFRTVGATERPDVIAGGLLEGRIALVLDGTPVVIEIPYIFAESFQVAEDYYQNFWFASIGRLLRMMCYFLSITVPGIFVSLVSFHQELLPTDLALSVSQARVGVPFPIAVECFLMIAVFEILREASQRLPDSISQALSIVGAIVIGDAAVSARFIGSTTLIVVAFAGITGLISPRLKSSVIVLRFVILLLGSLLGLYGVLFGCVGIAVYLLSMKSFSVPYLSYCFSAEIQNQKDIYIRAPWWTMRIRPAFISKDRIRKKE